MLGINESTKNKTVKTTFAYAQFSDQIKNYNDNEGEKYFHDQSEGLGTEISLNVVATTRVGTLIVATIYLQLIQNRYMFRSFTVLQCSHEHCAQPVASDVEVVGYF